MTKVIYVSNDFLCSEEGEVFNASEFGTRSSEEKLEWAEKQDKFYVTLFDTLESFEWAFNNEEISDLGYIFFVE